MVKTPNEVKDYSIDWTDRLAGDTISTSAFTVPSGITLDSQTNDTTSSTAWISGGTDGTDYNVTCLVTTAGGRTYEWPIRIQVRDAEA